MSLIWSNQSSK